MNKDRLEFHSMKKFSFATFRPDSLANVEEHWIKEVKHYCKNVPIILVGNKIDLRTDSEIIKELASNNMVRILQGTCFEEGMKYYSTILFELIRNPLLHTKICKVKMIQMSFC